MCKLHDQLQRGDHTIIIGEVVEARTDDSKMPLLYWKRGYRTVTT